MGYAVYLNKDETFLSKVKSIKECFGKLVRDEVFYSLILQSRENIFNMIVDKVVYNLQQQDSKNPIDLYIERKLIEKESKALVFRIIPTILKDGDKEFFLIRINSDYISGTYLSSTFLKENNIISYMTNTNNPEHAKKLINWNLAYGRNILNSITPNFSHDWFLEDNGYEDDHIKLNIANLEPIIFQNIHTEGEGKYNDIFIENKDNNRHLLGTPLSPQQLKFKYMMSVFITKTMEENLEENQDLLYISLLLRKICFDESHPYEDKDNFITMKNKITPLLNNISKVYDICMNLGIIEEDWNGLQRSCTEIITKVEKQYISEDMPESSLIPKQKLKL